MSTNERFMAFIQQRKMEIINEQEILIRLEGDRLVTTTSNPVQLLMNKETWPSLNSPKRF